MDQRAVRVSRIAERFQCNALWKADLAFSRESGGGLFTQQEEGFQRRSETVFVPSDPSKNCLWTLFYPSK